MGFAGGNKQKGMGKMGKWEILGLKAVKGVGKAGNMGFRLFITPQDDNAIKTFEKQIQQLG